MNAWIAVVIAVLLPTGASAAAADARRNVDARDIEVVSKGQDNEVGVSVGGIEGAEAEGVTVINGKVFIDGRAVPDSATRYRARSGVVYLIRRSTSRVEVVDEASAEETK